ncbi:hypothetical protein MP228_006939 [Amoeboaphelidium protococcarum]|nr:hypothetical protein MP228_006939 [Amoeboaphelidium protococcarum]
MSSVTLVDLSHGNQYSVKDIKKWNEIMVRQWLKDIGFEQYNAYFADHNIDGHALLQLNHSFLKEMGIKSVGERMKLLILIKRIQKIMAGKSDRMTLTRSNSQQSMENVASLAAGLKISTSQQQQSDAYNQLGGRQPSPAVTTPSKKSFGHVMPESAPLLKNSPSPQSAGSQSARKIASAGVTSVQSPQSPSSASHLYSNSNINNLQSHRVDNVQGQDSDSAQSRKHSNQKRLIRVYFDSHSVVLDVSQADSYQTLLGLILKKFGIPTDNLWMEINSWAILVRDGTAARLLRQSEVNTIGDQNAHEVESLPRLFLRRRNGAYVKQQQSKRGQSPTSRSQNKVKKILGVQVPFQNQKRQMPSISEPQASSPNRQYDQGAKVQKSPQQRRAPDSSGRGVSHIMTQNLVQNADESTNAAGIASPRSSNLTSTKLKNFFGERPPSELIAGNLIKFFPSVKSPPLIKNQQQQQQQQDMIAEQDEQDSAETSSVSDNNGDFQEIESIEQSSVGDKASIAARISQDEYKIVEESGDQQLSTSRQSQASRLQNAQRPSASSSPQGTLKRKSSNKRIKWVKGALVGTGSFGNVYLGLNAFTGEFMAVKQVLLPVDAQMAKSESSEVPVSAPSAVHNNAKIQTRRKQMVEALQREIGLLRELEHPNIVRYLGSESTDSYLNIFLEYVPGGSLCTVISTYGTIEEALIKTYVRQILGGLSYLHQKNIVHRDIKSANILVDNKGIVKISDFGISKKMAQADVSDRGSVISLYPKGVGGNRTSALQGSVFWLSPEVVKHFHYSKKSDVWSFGCLVIEMFTGTHPWPNMNQMAAMFRIGQKNQPPYPDTLSPEAKDLLQQCLALNYKERPDANQLLSHKFLA